MQSKHYISLFAAIALIILLYFGMNTKPFPKTARTILNNEGPMGNAMAMQKPKADAASDAEIFALIKNNLPVDEKSLFLTLKGKIEQEKDSIKQLPLYEELAAFGKSTKQSALVAYCKKQIGHLTHSEKNLTFAGQIFLELTHTDTLPAIQMWESLKGIESFEEALAINPNNDTLKLALAAGYVEGSGETMKGVKILKGITEKEPDNIPANLMLGRMGIQSGQIDKAIGRFETVLKVDSKNKEALYFCAEAYKQKGDKKKALELFDACKKVVNNSAFTKEIEAYEKTFN